VNGPTAESLANLRRDLLAWYERNRRDLPWRRTNDPYAIWISETMLQQTRVAAVIPFYERFMAQFPNVNALANASESELLSAWAGLGYYYRARNLQKAAAVIVAAGEFPRTYDDMASLPGVGPYTTAAVASIAYGLPHPVVDGNVYRVLSRLFGDMAAHAARQHFTVLAEKLLDRERPGVFNQAVMELGATVCLPRRPQCLLCPVRNYCAASTSGDPESLPVKTRVDRRPEETRTVFWIERNGFVLAWQRPANSRLMPGFWELPEPVHVSDAVRRSLIGTFRHSITIHDFRFELWDAELSEAEPAHACVWILKEQVTRMPISTIFRKALRLRMKAPVEKRTERSRAAP
jgi:A/G-specific adenine glycosylase